MYSYTQIYAIILVRLPVFGGIVISYIVLSGYLYDVFYIKTLKFL